MLLNGKVAIVTGGGSKRGLGQATARLFAEQGATVAILDRDGDAARERAAELGDVHLGLACDVTDKESCLAAAAEVEQRLGGVTTLVNNAGITQPLKIMEISGANYDQVLDVNLRGTLYMSQAVIPLFRHRHNGAIMNISSVSAQRGGGIFGGPHYAAAKAGILGLTKAMARELGPEGIRVNAVCPGFIDTDITGGKLTPEMLEQIVAGIPMGRAGQAEDVAGCCLFLASDLSSYCTGTEVDVNGGSHIH